MNQDSEQTIREKHESHIAYHFVEYADGRMSITKAVKSLDEYFEVESAKREAIYEADIAQAIGYCQGLGHPNKYLESRYPGLAGKKDART